MKFTDEYSSCIDDYEKDEKAYEWFKKAAERNNAMGMAYYSRCLLRGIGVKQNQEESILWSRKALGK